MTAEDTNWLARSGSRGCEFEATRFRCLGFVREDLWSWAVALIELVEDNSICAALVRNDAAERVAAVNNPGMIGKHGVDIPASVVSRDATRMTTDLLSGLEDAQVPMSAGEWWLRLRTICFRPLDLQDFFAEIRR